MKINTFIAGATMLLVVVYALVLNIKPDEYDDMARFIPDNALIYFEQHDETNWFDRIAISHLGNKIRSIDIAVTGNKLGLSSDILTRIKRIITNIDKANKLGVIEEIFGNKLAVALLPPLSPSPKYNPLDFLHTNVIVVTKPGHNTELLEFIGRKYSKQEENITVTNHQYGNHRIQRIVADNETLSLVTIDGFFILSFNERQLRHAIDVYDSKLEILSLNHEFIKQRKNFRKPTRFIYLPIDNMRNALHNIAEVYDFPQKKLFLKELKTTTGFTSVGYGAWQGLKRVDDKVVVQYDKTTVNDLVKKHLVIPPSKSTMFSLTSAKPMLYYWSNAFNFSHFLLYLKDDTNSDSNYVGFLHNLEISANMSGKDVFALLGKQVSLNIEQIPKNTRFPIPLGIIFIEIKDVEKIKSTLQNLIYLYNIPMIKRKYGSITYYYWSRSFQDGIQPLYGFWHQYLFLANSSRLLKSVIDRNIAGKTIFSDLVTQRLDPGLLEKNNSVTYTNNIDILGIIKQSLYLIATAVTIQDRDAAAKMRITIEEIVTPVFEGADMYDISVTRSFFSDNKIIIQSRTNIVN